MRISRPCYDKPHVCPGSRGGGWKYAKVQRCEGGYLDREIWGNKLLGRFRFNRHETCGVLVLPLVVKWLEPETWIYYTKTFIRNASYTIKFRLGRWQKERPLRKIHKGCRNHHVTCCDPNTSLCGKDVTDTSWCPDVDECPRMECRRCYKAFLAQRKCLTCGYQDRLKYWNRWWRVQT